MVTVAENVGDLLREWRQRRGLSQLRLAMEAEVSSRHVSFIESGRAAPSRDMLLRLAEPLAMTARARNRLLLAAGYAPMHTEHALTAAAMDPVRAALDSILSGHEPFPALAMDGRWNLVASNAAVAPLLVGVAPELLEPPVNVLRLSLHPQGLASRILNLADWRHHLLARLRDDVLKSGDRALAALLDEVRSLPFSRAKAPPAAITAVAVPLIIVDPETEAVLSFLSTTTVFGTATDITLGGLMLECFYPADKDTRSMLLSRSVGAGMGSSEAPCL